MAWSTNEPLQAISQVAVFLGIATFGCPSCILPIAGRLGLVFTAQTLPFFGIEFHVLSLLILVGTFAWLIRLVRKRKSHMLHANVH